MNNISQFNIGLKGKEASQASLGQRPPQGLGQEETGLLSMSELLKRRQFMGLDDHSLSILRETKKTLMTAMPAVLDGFYKKVRAEPEIARFFNSETMIHAARAKQQEHWGRVTNGVADEAYLHAALGIGKVHEQIGLEPHWYIGTYALLIDGLVAALIADNWPKTRFGRELPGQNHLAEKVGSFIRMALLDMQLTISAYLSTINSHARQKDIQKQMTMDSAITGMSEAVQGLAHGDLRFRIGDDFPTDYSMLKVNFNEAVERLAETILGLHGSAYRVNASIKEISASATEQSRRAEAQAASLEQSTAALGDLTETVKKTAAGVEQVSKSVKIANASAADVDIVVTQAGEAMAEINESSRKISNIIGLIDEIAFQTNLLALNAGVEAARAGDAGRGFAVVATEVRALAQRSAEAAKEIKSLISLSGQQVVRGVALVQKSGTALKSVTQSVAEIDGLATSILESSRSQSIGLTQVNEALNSMSRDVQVSAARVEQTTSSIQSLGHEIDFLSKSLNVFKV